MIIITNRIMADNNNNKINEIEHNKSKNKMARLEVVQLNRTYTIFYASTSFQSGHMRREEACIQNARIKFMHICIVLHHRAAHECYFILGQKSAI